MSAGSYRCHGRMPNLKDLHNRRANKILGIDSRFVFISNIEGADEGDQKSAGGNHDETHSEFLITIVSRDGTSI